MQCIRLQISRHDQVIVVKTTNVCGEDVPPELNNGVPTLQFWLPKNAGKIMSPPIDVVTPSATDANYNEEPTLAGRGREGGGTGRGNGRDNGNNQELTIVFRFDNRTELEIFRSKIAPEIIRVRSLYREHEKERMMETQKLSQEKRGKQISSSMELGKKDTNDTSKLNGVKMSLAFVDPLGLQQTSNNETSISVQGKEVKTGQSSLTVTSTKGRDPTDTLPYAQRMTETELETQNVILATKKATTKNLNASTYQLTVQTQKTNGSSDVISKGKSNVKKKKGKASNVTLEANKKARKQKQVTETSISSTLSSSSSTSSSTVSSISPSLSPSAKTPSQTKKGKGIDKDKHLESNISEDTITETSDDNDDDDDDPSYSLRTRASQKKQTKSLNKVQIKKKPTKQQVENPKIIIINTKKNNKNQDKDTNVQSSASSSTTEVDNNVDKRGEEMNENSTVSSTPSSESIIEKSRSISKAKASPIPDSLKSMANSLTIPLHEKENKSRPQPQTQNKTKTKPPKQAQLPTNKTLGGKRRRGETDQNVFLSTKRAAPGLTQALQRSNSLSPSLSNPALAIETAFGNLQAAVANQRKRLGEACARQSLSDIEEMTRVFSETTGSRLDALETGIKMRYEELTTQIRAESRQISSIFNDFIVAIEAAQKQHENTSQDIKEFIRLTNEEIKETEKTQKAEAAKVKRRIEQAKKRWRRRIESAEEITAGVQRMREYIRSLDRMTELK